MAKAKKGKAKKSKYQARTALQMLSAHPDGSLRLVAAAFDLRKPYAVKLAQQHVEHYRAEELRQTRLAARYNALADTLSETCDIVAMAYGIMTHRPKAQKARARAQASGRCAQAIEAVIIAFERQAQTWRNDEGETPEARVYASRDVDPILALEIAGKITKKQASDAREIAAIFHATSKALFAKIGGLGSGGGGGAGDWITARMALKRKYRYQPWIKEIARNKIPLPFLIEVMIDGYALSAAADHYRMSHETGLKKLRKAMVIYARIKRHDETDYEEDDAILEQLAVPVQTIS